MLCLNILLISNFCLVENLASLLTISGGIRFEVLKVKSKSQDERKEAERFPHTILSQTTYLQLQNRIIPFISIFPNLQKITAQATNALLM